MKKISKLLLALLFFCLVVNVKARTYTEEEYKGLNISRGYVICNYVFDLSSYNPGLKDFLLASQSCPSGSLYVYDIKYSKTGTGQSVSSYIDLLTGQKLDSFPNIDIKFVEKSSIATHSSETVLDSTPVSETDDLQAINVDSNKFKSLGVNRTYVVGSYIFDIASHNPTLKDLMLANQTAPLGEANIYEIKYGKDIDGNSTATYRELVGNSSLNDFPNLKERYIYYGEVKPTQPNSEAKLDLLNNIDPNVVSGIKLSETDINLQFREEKQITAEVLPVGAANGGFTWTSSNPDVVTVENGLIKAKTDGRAIITVTSSNGTTAEINVLVGDANKVATIICEDKVFNGQEQAIAVCSGGTLENHMQTYGGNYQVTCTGDDTHSDAVPQTCKILRTDTTTSLSPKETIYSGDVQPMTGATSTYNSTGESIENAAYTYKYYSDSSCTMDETLNAPVNAGTYYVKAVLTLHTDYNSSESPCVAYTVHKLDNTFTFVKQEKDYVGYGIDAVVEMTYSKSIEENLNVYFTYYTDASCTNKTLPGIAANIMGGAPIAAGEYYVIGVSEGNNNYNSVTSECTQAVTVNKIDAVCPIITSYEGDYVPSNDETGAIVRRFTVDNPPVGGVTMYCVEDCDNEENWSEELPTRTNAGITTVNVKVVGDISHNTVDCSQRTIKINRVYNEIELTYQNNMPYTSERIEALVTAHEVTRDQIEVDYFLNDPSCTETPTEPINTGIYYVKVTTPQTTNYKETTTGCLLGLKIVKTNTTTTLDPITDLIYNGNPQPASGAASKFNSNDKDIMDSTNPIDKPDEGMPSYTYNYYTDLGCSETVENTYAMTNAGNYYMKVTLNETSNYNSSESECVRYIINPKQDVITIHYTATGDETEGVYDYDGNGHEAIATNLSGNKITFTYYSDSNCNTLTTLDNAVGDGEMPKNAGTYYVDATTEQDPTDNYSNINNITNTNYAPATVTCVPAVTINKVPATITCHNKVYNTQEQIIAECDFGTISNHLQTNKGDYEIACAESTNHSAVNKTCKVLQADTMVEVIGNNQDVDNNAETRKVYRNYTGSSQGLDKETDRVKSYVFDPNDEREPKVLTEISNMATYTYKYYTNDSCTAGETTSAPINAGTYYVKAILNETDDYKTSYDCVPYIVKKVKATINVTYQEDVPYSGNVVNAIGTTNSGALSYRYYTDLKCTLPTTKDHANVEGGPPKAAGTYWVKATSAESTNYEETTAEECFKAITITPIDAVCPTINNYNGVYSPDNNTTPPTIEIVGTPTGGSLIFKVDSGESTTNGEWVIDPPTRTNVGETTVHIKVVGDNNHNDVTCPDRTITITKKTDVVTINPNKPNHILEVDYNTDHHFASATAESIQVNPNSTAYVSILYYSDSTCETQIAGSPINAGTYWVMVTSSGDNNYAPNTPVCTKAVVINKVAATCPTITENVNEVYSSGTYHSIGVSEPEPSGGELQFRIGTNGNWTTTNPQIENASTQEIYVQVEGDLNHNTADCGHKTLTIRKAPSAITCASATYTGNPHNIASCSGGTVNGNMQTNAGSHTITCVGDSNHENSTSSCNIDKSNTTTSLNEITRTYSGRPQEATGATSNLSSTGGRITNAQYTYAYFTNNICTEVSDVPKYGGTYYVKATLVATSNYNSSDSPCTKYTMNQNKPQPTITCTNVTYNGNEQVIATCDGGTIYSEKHTDAGTYEVICNGDAEHSVNTKNCTIAKAEPTCPGYQSVTASYTPEAWHYIQKTSNGVGGIVEYKRDVCNWENHTGNNITADSHLEWTPNFDQTGATIKGVTNISVRIVEDNNYNSKTCGTYSITIN